MWQSKLEHPEYKAGILTSNCYAMEGVLNLIFLFSGNRLCYAMIMIPVHLHDELRIQERKKSGMCSMCGGNHGK